ncbi:Homeobox protein Hox-A2 [Leucoagaricus sp. SymC.cos]|nr:Homeobox protein Hox-A2 [Leucoagaricus sp. SymC.cos]
MDHHYTHNSFAPAPSCTTSDDTVCLNNVNPTTSRRTRKRFTNVQLMMLENLFHQNSHPSREDREAVAKAGGMEIKSVTIWFQNKRQTERKSAASNHSSFNTPPLTHQPTARRTSSPTFTNRSSASTTSRPSLDRVASRSELRAPAPRTPSKRLDPNATLWDNMPSSPIVDPNSPPAREYVEFGKKRRTLEWACAAARLAEKDGVRPSSAGPAVVSRPSSRTRTREHQPSKLDLEVTDDEEDEIVTPPGTWCESDAEKDGVRPSSAGPAVVSRPSSRTRTREHQPSKLDLEVTDDEEDEIVTPPGTWCESDSRWSSDPRGDGAIVTLPSSRTHEYWKKRVDDDDGDEIMKAALALCGLQNRRVV